jgi:large subunit ribosomal protein L3
MGTLIGKKLGMTQLYNEKEDLIPVTVVEAGPCPIVQVRTSEKNGYAAVQLAFEKIPARKVNKPKAGQFAKAGIEPHRIMREFRLQEEGDFEVGQVLDVSQFEIGDGVRVTGKSKGKGFAGVVRRHNFRGHNTTHGTPDRVRHGGAIGQGTTPGKVWKGKKMPGHLGDDKVTVKGLTVIRVDAERNLLFLKGAVPGGTNGYLAIQKA